jgi:hypothetical protein
VARDDNDSSEEIKVFHLNLDNNDYIALYHRKI